MSFEFPVELGYSYSWRMMASINIQMLNTPRSSIGIMQQNAQMPMPARAAAASPSEL